MAWKQSGQPTIQQQRGKWVARVEGIDTETGRRRPRQIGTFSSKRAAQRAATAFAASGDALAERDTVAGLVDRWVASRVDVGPKTRLQYEWAAGHIREGLGGVRVDQLERADVARWLDGLAASGRFSRRSRVDEVFDRWANPEDRTGGLRALHGALDEWKRWASGKDIPEQQLAAAFAALSTTSRPGCNTLAAALAPAVPNHMLGPAPLEVDL